MAPWLSVEVAVAAVVGFDRSCGMGGRGAGLHMLRMMVTDGAERVRDARWANMNREKRSTSCSEMLRCMLRL